MANKDAANYNKTLIKIQQLANNSAKTIQQLINKSNKTQMDFNSAESQKARDWQEQMSKKSHQMEVQDLKKAGLNPVLSANSGGAQSYTTSSASTQNDSGSSAIASMLSGELGAMSNMESARMSSDAQMKSATLQAKANRYAAQQSAAAQKYAADQSYKLGVYRANLEYQSQQEQRENQRWITKNQTATSWVGMLDKTLRNFGFYDAMTKNGKTLFKKFLSGQDPNAKQAFSGKDLAYNVKNGKLTNQGYQICVDQLRSNGFSASPTAVKLYYQGCIKHDSKSVKKLLKYYNPTGPVRSNKVNPFAVKPGYR